MMLEKLARGLVHRIFMAFIRFYQEMQEERAAQDAINARLAGLDEANRAKLKVFLMGKEKQKNDDVLQAVGACSLREGTSGAL
jgi:hypothetical protein